jgi:hypothetical protein
LPVCDVKLAFEPVRLLPSVGIEVDDSLCLWFGLGEREIFLIRFADDVTSSDKLDCSETPLSHVSYSASDCDDGDGQGESSVISSSMWEGGAGEVYSGGGGVASFSSSCN